MEQAEHANIGLLQHGLRINVVNTHAAMPGMIGPEIRTCIFPSKGYVDKFAFGDDLCVLAIFTQYGQSTWVVKYLKLLKNHSIRSKRLNLANYF